MAKANDRAPARKRQRSLAELVEEAIGPALSAQGFAGREIVTSWSLIAGERLAGFCRPQKIIWPRRRPMPQDSPQGSAGEAPEAAALVLRVEGAFALEAQQLAPIIIQRVNAHLGWRAVDRLVLKQGPVPHEVVPEPPRAEIPPPLPVQQAVAAIADPDLRQALARLGGAVARKA